MAPSHMKQTPKKDRDPSIKSDVHTHIPGILVGEIFASRYDIAKAGLHVHVTSGIHGSKSDGAYSVVLSGGYESDQDFGNIIYYTGCGGRDYSKHGFGGEQRRDQTWESLGNAALLTSCKNGKPLRVIRGAKAQTRFSPAEGYRYDGLYRVRKTWNQTLSTGFEVCMVKLVRCRGQPALTGLERLSPALASENERDRRGSPSSELDKISQARMRLLHTSGGNNGTIGQPPPSPSITPAPKSKKRRFNSSPSRSGNEGSSKKRRYDRTTTLSPVPRSVTPPPRFEDQPLDDQPPAKHKSHNVSDILAKMQAECLRREASDTGIQVDSDGD